MGTPRLNTMEQDLEKYFDRLFPICRSITGNGVRETLKILREIIPLKTYEVPSEKKVFDWEIPQEWNIKDAYIITPSGKKICSFKENNLHLISYSVPVNKEMSFEELAPHLHTLPELPDAIPYLTSYYKKSWGFCLSHREYQKLDKKGRYKVVIQSELKNGFLTYGDLVLKGKSTDEILFSTYICHPGMANNELSGPLVTAFLYRKIKELKNRKYTYRFVFVPETIGAIHYLSRHGKQLKKNLKAGYVITCVGVGGKIQFMRSRMDDSLTNRLTGHVLQHQNTLYEIHPFAIGGSDERQYCSPGFNLPVGRITGAKFQRHPEYHTSLDNKNFISFADMNHFVEFFFRLVNAFELNDYYKNTVPFCEPNLGKRGLYPQLGGQKQRTSELTNMLHLLNYADGSRDLIEIANLRHESVFEFKTIVESLSKQRLIRSYS